MPKSIPEPELQAISGIVPPGHRGLTAHEIAAALHDAMPLRTLQYRLRHLVAAGRLERDGRGRWIRYRQPDERTQRDGTDTLEPNAEEWAAIPEDDASPQTRTFPGILSPRAVALLRRLRERPPRRTSGERRRLLDAYRPDRNGYLTRRERAGLAAVAAIGNDRDTFADGFAGRGERFEFDLVWNAARLSGSRYTAQQARRLLKFGRPAEGRDPFDTQTVLNHRAGLRFLLDARRGADLDTSALRNLHAILAHNLIPDESMTGRWRVRLPEGSAIPVRSAATCHDPVEQDVLRFLKITRSIADPFEQALFLMVQILHVAPFAEMNECVALHAANIPLLRAGLAPQSFVDWPRDLYASAVRGVVERNRVDLLRDLFVWGYQRSAQRLGAGAAARSVPDPFRLTHDAELRAAVSEVIRQGVPQRELPAWLEFRIAGGLPADLRPRFVGVVTAELDGLHEGNFARYDVTVDEFRAWRAGWLRDCTDIQRLV